MAQAKKARQRISYVLENAKSSEGGHRLGVNGLAVDPVNNILYSGGRDGIVCAWDVNFNRPGAASNDATSGPAKTKLKAQCSAHMNWINDITLAQNYTAVVSASSDLSVKVWRPYSEEDNKRAIAIGEHADYIKCVASTPAGANADIVASGGLDRKVCLWDLTGKGKTLEIDVTGEEIAQKGSVYGLALGRTIVASGGPEKTIRLHDPRSGSKVSKLMGHVANIRSILIDDEDDTILSASADKTIKLWSVRGGRCMYTFSMHDESIWSLFSDDPKLGIFYSCDRSGLIAKTDIRVGLEHIDSGMSIAVAQEHCGVGRIVAANGHIWTATDRSSVNCWTDVDTGPDARLPASYRHQRNASLASNKSWRAATSPNSQGNQADSKPEINPESILRMSNMAAFSRSGFDADHSAVNDALIRRASEVAIEPQSLEIKPVRQVPEHTIEGQFGLLKHKLLNDRRRVLTLDTAGDVLLWDLLECKAIQSFGKQHIEDVEASLNTRDTVAPWCSIDVISGNLTVVLEPFNCFDAEVYADELDLKEPVEFKDDQRISLGRWVLRYLFANLIDEEIKRDEAHRQKLNDEIEKKIGSAPGRIAIPTFDDGDGVSTPRAPGGGLPTPGIGIGVVTPGALANTNGNQGATTTENADNGITEKDDYFASRIGAVETAKPAAETSEGKTSTDGNDKSKDEKKDKATDGAKSPSTPFGKKFRMSFSSKKLGRSPSMATQEKPVIDEKAVESESSSNHEKEVDDSFYGVIQKIHNEYDKQMTDAPDKRVETRVTPSLPTDTPVLKIPPGTQIFIQEETSGGSSTIYSGTVEGVGRDADIIEQKAPMWLGDVLLQNQIPIKDPVKISFVLHPIGDLLAVSQDGNARLNANRMLRVRKVLSYVAERIEPPPGEGDETMAPEKYLELYCNDQLLSPTMTLATLRTHIWKAGSDIVLYYKANGVKKIRPPPVSVFTNQAPEGSEAVPATPASPVAT